MFYVPWTARSLRDPHLLSLAKDVELGKYTVPIGNRTPGSRMAVHYATAAPCKSLIFLQDRPDLLLQIFDLGSEGGDNEVDGEMLAETDEVPYECGARYVKALKSEWLLR